MDDIVKVAHGYMLDRLGTEHIDHWNLAKFARMFCEELAHLYGTSLTPTDIAEISKRVAIREGQSPYWSQSA